MPDARENFARYSRCVLQVVVTDDAGDEHSATAFHIGDGYLVTARHVVAGAQQVWVGDGITVREVLLPSEDGVDLALIATDLELTPERHTDGSKDRDLASAISIGSHLDDWLDDGYFMLQSVLVMGYPPVPQSREPVLVAVEAQVATVIDKYTNQRHPHFVLSSIPRGGFSGGPVLVEDFLLGVMTESLLNDDQPLETGFAAALTVEPLLSLMIEHSVYPKGWNGDLARELTPGMEPDADWLEKPDEYLPPPEQTESFAA